MVVENGYITQLPLEVIWGCRGILLLIWGFAFYLCLIKGNFKSFLKYMGYGCFIEAAVILAGISRPDVQTDWFKVIIGSSAFIFTLMTLIFDLSAFAFRAAGIYSEEDREKLKHKE